MHSKISVVIPIYNEEGNIINLIEELIPIVDKIGGEMKKFLTIFASFIFLSLILPNNLEFTDIQIQANQSGVIELSLDNPQDQIAGIQFQIVDYPNHGLFTAIDPSDRLDGFMVEFYEQEDGSVIVVGFSLTGGVIGTGSGPILSLTYQSTNQYSSEIEISLIEESE